MNETNKNTLGPHSDLQERIVSYLKSRGIRHVSTNQFIQFMHNGLNFLVLFEDDSPNYFRLAIPNVMENYNRPISEYKIIDLLNAKYKVAKAYTYPSTSSLWIVAEQFVYSFIIDSLMDQLLSILHNYYQDLCKELANNGR